MNFVDAVQAANLSAVLFFCEQADLRLLVSRFFMRHSQSEECNQRLRRFESVYAVHAGDYRHRVDADVPSKDISSLASSGSSANSLILSSASLI